MSVSAVLLLVLCLVAVNSKILMRSGDVSINGVDANLQQVLSKHATLESRKQDLSSLRQDFIHILVEVTYVSPDTRTTLQATIQRAHAELHADLALQDIPINYIPRNAFSLLVHPSAVESLLALSEVSYVGHYAPEYKFMNLNAPDPSRRYGEDTVSFHVTVDMARDVTEVVAELDAIIAAAVPTYQLIVGSNSRLVLVLDDDKSRVETAAHAVCQHEAVAWIEPLTAKRSFNSDASWIVQSGIPDETPIHDHGIRGQGIVVGVSDSGADYTNCLLSDEGVEPNFCMACVFGTNESCDFTGHECHMPEPSQQHRKIPVYWAFVDKLDDAVGHGTHVTGSVIGNMAVQDDPINAFNGTAPESRVVFMDASGNDGDGSLQFPEDLNVDYFPFFSQNGATIVSQSWGSMSWCNGSVPVSSEEVYYAYYYMDYYEFMDTFIQCGVYNSFALDIDRHVHENQDMLVLFAAGNSGDDGYYTMGNEALNKNGLAIGASRTSFNHLFDTSAPYQARSIADVITDEDYWCQLIFFNVPANLTEGKNCSEWAAYYAEILLSAEACCDAEVTDPIMASLLDSSGWSCCPDTIGRAVNADFESGVADERSIASFSSRGPATDDYRLKPDLLSPGDVIVSAASAPDHTDRYQCSTDPWAQPSGLRSMSGTSMACPHAAASAALVQQYFEDGFAACNGVACDEGFLPTAAMIKATMINSAVPIFGHMYQDAVLEDIVPLDRSLGHQFVTGHGVLQLSNALGFQDENGVQSPVFEYLDASSTDMRELTRPAEFYFKDVTIADVAGDLSVTLAWSDAPSAEASTIQLVNDLDLVVYRSDCFEFTGNEYLGLDLIEEDESGAMDGPREVYARAHGRFRDPVNNVERVFLEDVRPGVYRIEISSHTMAMAPQSWSLAINYPASAPSAAMTCPHYEALKPNADRFDVEIKVTLNADVVIDESFQTDWLRDVARALSIDPDERLSFSSVSHVAAPVITFVIHDVDPDHARQPTAAYLLDLFTHMFLNGDSVLFEDDMATGVIDNTVLLQSTTTPQNTAPTDTTTAADTTTATDTTNAADTTAITGDTETTTGTTGEGDGSSFPWGIIAVSSAVIVVGFAFYKWRTKRRVTALLDDDTYARLYEPPTMDNAIPMRDPTV